MARFYTLGVLVILILFLSASTSKVGLSKEEVSLSIIEWSQKISLLDNYNVKINTTKSIIILHKDGLPHGHIAIPYDQLNTIKKFEALLSNPVTGKIIRKLKLKDLQDQSYISDGSVYEDGRVKYFEVKSTDFPLKVDISIETVSEGNFILPTWRPAIFPNQRVTSASLEIVYPLALGLRYKALNIDQEPLKHQDASQAILKWEIKDLFPLNADIRTEDIPAIKLAPEKFSMQGYQSNMSSWEGLARWQGQLNRERDHLPKDLKVIIKELTEHLSTQEEKLEVLYNYLQKNFRYVSIQLGIGGWMPATVEDVVIKKYGDCKGLSFLMQAMLKEVGISSHYAKVLAGNDKDDIDISFPSNQFNHIILKVSLEGKEPVWLECTSSLLPAGYLGDFTMNRHVLVVDGDGGYIDKTPSYDQPTYNHSTYNTYYKLDKNGNAALMSKQEFRGFAAEDLFYLHSKANERDQKKFLMENIKLPGLVISNFNLDSRSQAFMPQAMLTVEGHTYQFYQSTAKRMLIKSPFQHISLAQLPNNALELEEKISIESMYQLHPESSLEDIFEKHEHYNLKISYQIEENMLTMHRKLELKFDKDFSEENKLNTIKHLNEVSKKVLLFKKPND